MFKIKFVSLSYFILSIGLMNGCSVIDKAPAVTTANKQNHVDREIQLAKFVDWQITGKIGFIQKNKRETASINWLVNKSQQKQALNLTTFLGINVLQLKSDHNQHSIEVDGKTYYGDNLDDLVYDLTGLNLPTKALKSWLKGVKYQVKDKIKYHPTTWLPTELISEHNNQEWTIHFANYKLHQDYRLATKFTIVHQDLTIKINIYRWSFI